MKEDPVGTLSGAGGGGEGLVAIADGLFDPEEDVRLFEGRGVVAGGREVPAPGAPLPPGAVLGVVIGPFGKAGKCKVAFPAGAPVGVGTKLVLR